MKEIMRLKQDQYFIDAYEMLCKKRKLTQKDKEYILGAAVFLRFLLRSAARLRQNRNRSQKRKRRPKEGGVSA